MNALATQERSQTEPSAPALFKPAGSTLEDLVLNAWEDLAQHAVAECPVCDGALTAAGCADCGSQLS